VAQRRSRRRPGTRQQPPQGLGSVDRTRRVLVSWLRCGFRFLPIFEWAARVAPSRHSELERVMGPSFSPSAWLLLLAPRRFYGPQPWCAARRVSAQCRFANKNQRSPRFNRWASSAARTDACALVYRISMSGLVQPATAIRPLSEPPWRATYGRLCVAACGDGIPVCRPCRRA
jgi:hypothetical protein